MLALDNALLEDLPFKDLPSHIEVEDVIQELISYNPGRYLSPGSNYKRPALRNLNKEALRKDFLTRCNKTQDEALLNIAFECVYSGIRRVIEHSVRRMYQEDCLYYGHECPGCWHAKTCRV